MEFRVLGPLELIAAGRPVDLGTPRLRALLARLLIDANEVVAVDRLLEDLWSSDLPDGGVGTLHVHISKLRHLLASVGCAAAIVTRPPGYTLELDPETVDAVKFERMWRDARSRCEATPRRAAATLRRALGLWRGPALADFIYESFAQSEIRRLEELRLVALEDLLEAELADGRHAEVVGRLDELVCEYPLRERLWGALMVAQYQGGRQADALKTFQAARSALIEGLGIEPSYELRELEERILLHDASLHPPEPAPSSEPVLPLRLTSFVGRWQDRVALSRMLAEHRLVTLVGAGGVGKTSLAIETGRQCGPAFPDGIWLVPLDGASGTSSVAAEIAAVLGLRVPDSQDVNEVVARFLRPRQALLVFDGCEHLLEAVAVAVRSMLEVSPDLRILATSRLPLGAEGEHLYRLDPLPVPESGIEDPTELSACPSVAMFVDRAVAVRPDFALEERNAASVGRICRATAGIPLAIELATARLQSMSPRELADQMDDQIGILTGGNRTALRRHRTLEASMSLSYRLLSERDRALFECVGAFHGSFGLEAIAVADGENDPDYSSVRDGIGRLVAASLVIAGDEDGVTRHRTLEPVRQYAAAMLRASPREFDVLLRHAQWHAAKAAELAEELEAGRLERAIDEEHELRADLREALRWAIDTGEHELALSLASSLGSLWIVAGPMAEGHRWVDAALTATPPTPSVERFHVLDLAVRLGIAGNEPVEERLRELTDMAASLPSSGARARVAYLRGYHAWSDGRLAEAVDLLRTACRLAGARSGPRIPGGRPEVLLTECLIRIGALDEAERLLEEHDEQIRREGRTRDYALVENLGMLAYVQADLQRAERLLEEAVRGFGRLRSRAGQMNAMSYLAWITIELGDDQRTELLARRALVMAREDGDVMIEANCLWLLARSSLAQGDLTQARLRLAECVRIAEQRGERIVLVHVLYVAAELAFRAGAYDRSIRLFASAENHRRAIPHILGPHLAAHYEQLRRRLARAAGDAAFAAAWDAGAAASLRDALADVACEGVDLLQG